MGQEDNVFALKNPLESTDLLTEVLRSGARQLLAAAIEAEVEKFLNQHNQEGSKARFVRNGYLPECTIQTDIGDVVVEVPRVRDRSKEADGSTFYSTIVTKYLRRKDYCHFMIFLRSNTYTYAQLIRLN